MVKSSPCPWLEVFWVLYRAGRLSPKLLSSDKHENTFFVGQVLYPRVKKMSEMGEFLVYVYVSVCLFPHFSSNPPSDSLSLTDPRK